MSKILCKRDLRKNSGFKKKEKLVFPSLNFLSALPVSVSTKKEAQAVFFLRCFFQCLTFLSHYSLIFTLISHSLCLNNFHPFSFFSFSQHLSFFLSDLLLVFPSFLSCFLYSNLIWSLSSKDESCFFSKLGVFPNNVSCRFLYTLLLCCRNSRKWGCWYQRNDHILSLTFVSYDVLFSKIILNVCGVYICLTREKMCGATCCGDPMFMFLQSWMEDAPLKLRQAVCSSFCL